MAIYVKRYNGSSWVNTTVKRYNGSSWVDAYTYRWDGSKWVQIYPETAITVSNKAVSGSGLTTYRTSYKDWKAGDAKQGSGADWDGSVANWGYVGIQSTSYTGSGSVSSVSAASFHGTRGSAGYYSNDQTIYFYRCSASTSGTPSTSNIYGSFTCKTGGPGSGKAITTKTISGTSAVKDFLNQVNSAKYLYIYSNATGDYLDLDAATLTLSYVYTASSAAYEISTSTVSLAADMPSTLAGKDSLHKMVIYNDEIDLPFEEVIRRRVDNEVEDIPASDIIEGYVPMPWTREKYVQEIDENKYMARVEVFSMGQNDEAQVSLDKYEWNTMYQKDPKTAYVEAELSSDYNRVLDWVYIRVIDRETGEVHCTTEIEPLFIV